MAQRVNLLGVPVSAFDLEGARAEMVDAIARGLRTYACCCPVFTLMQGHEEPEVRAALERADWVTPDGMPVVWALQARGATTVGRVYGPDLMLALSETSAREGYRQFYVGGAQGVAEELARRMRERFAGLEVAGTWCPAFGVPAPEDERAMIDAINASGAHVVWVGLGSPKQDLWMARHRDALEAPLLVGVGAAFDFFTGRQAQAPRWMQRSGLEWTFRLGHDPRRLWRRYLVYNPKFVLEMALQLSGLRSYE